MGSSSAAASRAPPRRGLRQRHATSRSGTGFRLRDDAEDAGKADSGGSTGDGGVDAGTGGSFNTGGCHCDAAGSGGSGDALLMMGMAGFVVVALGRRKKFLYGAAPLLAPAALTSLRVSPVGRPQRGLRPPGPPWVALRVGLYAIGRYLYATRRPSYAIGRFLYARARPSCARDRDLDARERPSCATGRDLYAKRRASYATDCDLYQRGALHTQRIATFTQRGALHTQRIATSTHGSALHAQRGSTLYANGGALHTQRIPLPLAQRARFIGSGSHPERAPLPEPLGSAGFA